MASTPALQVTCPTCKTTVAWLASERFKPFCSERCKLIDLGEWASEAHKIPGETIMQTEDLEQLDLFIQE